MTFGRSGQLSIFKSKLDVGMPFATSSLEVHGFASTTSLFSASSIFTTLLVNGSTTLQNVSLQNLVAKTLLANGSSTLQNFTATTATTTNLFSNNSTITTLSVGSLKTATNCSSSASPAVCGSASGGSVAMATGGSTLVVNTSAVTANSQILITEDSSLGTRLGITCNTTTGRIYTVSARTAGTSFTIKSSANPATNKACLNYWIVN
ncbi:hypothetical protein KW784_00085 [Candidatus Parcubacteria bacterium]|nr:hypothetical protein [Candidatus Parcubacteria bacterium]